MRLGAFRPLKKNTLRGFATVELANDLEIIDCPVHVSNGRAWASLPAKPLIDRDGRQIIADGKPQYAVVLKWRDRGRADRFSAAVVALVRQQHPRAFDEGAAP